MTPSLGVRVIAATLALIALLYVAATVGRLEGQIAPYLTPDSNVDTERKRTDMINYSHALPGGGTVSLTMGPKPEGQTWEAFAAEAAAAWAAVKAANGL